MGDRSKYGKIKAVLKSQGMGTQGAEMPYPSPWSWHIRLHLRSTPEPWSVSETVTASQLIAVPLGNDLPVGSAL